MTNSVKPRL